MRVWSLLFVWGMLGGCDRKEEIQRYRAPRDPRRDMPSSGQPPPRPDRILGAMLSHGDRMWFFKMMGPSERIEPHREEFLEFLKSVRFDKEGGEEAIRWTPPQEWRELPGGGMRFATFHVGPSEAPLELSVIPLPEPSGGILSNVNRWRSQLGLPPIDEDQLPACTSSIFAGTDPITVVDLKAGKEP